MNILVTGGTGTVGSAVVGRLLERGGSALVRVLSRSPSKTRDLPAGVEGAIGDLARPDTLLGPFTGTDALFLLVALAQDETQQGLAAVEAAKQAGVRRIVYMSVAHLEDFPEIPHFASKVPIERAVKQSGLEFTILRPNSFFQNDVAYADAIKNFGVYPDPIGSAGLSRVDVRDIADAAVASLMDAGHDKKTYGLAGPEALTGESTAAIYSRHLRRPVRYGGDDLNAWSQHARATLPEWLVRDLAIMLSAFQKKGLVATDAELRMQEEVLGHAPRRFDDFAAEFARA